MSTVKRVALIDNDTVTNVALWDGSAEWQPEGETLELADDSPIGPGWTRSGAEWIAPPDPDPNPLVV